MIEKMKKAATRIKKMRFLFSITKSEASKEKNVATIKKIVKYSRHLLEYKAVLINADTRKNRMMKFRFFKNRSLGYKRRYKKANPINNAIET